MTVAWIVYALVVGTLLAATALGIETACRLAGRPARWGWALALALTVALAGTAPHRASPAAGVTIDLSTARQSTSTAAPTAPNPLVAALRAVRAALAAPVERALVAAERRVPAALDRSLGALWTTLSVALLLLFGAVYARYRRARRGWPLADLQGTRVRLAPEAGPAVVGLSKPEIIVPRWLLLRTPDEQRLVLAHEQEHVAARDPLLIACACAAAALLPWHPAVWWMLSRLRLAVELDCDHRVLGRGVAPRSYGTLLIDLAGRSSGLPVGAPALADKASHLERRLLAMRPIRPRFARARTAALGAAAALALLAACEAKMPTSADVADMDVAKAENSARHASFMKMGDSTSTYTVDGKTVSAAEARAITPERIASIRVEKKNVDGAESSQVNIQTRAAAGLPDGVAGDTSMHMKVMVRHMEGSDSLGAHSTHSADMMVGEHEQHMRTFDGVLEIDGVRVDKSRMATLNPGDIVSMEVIKGPAAMKLYNTPDAANGVIRVTTKQGAAKK